MILQILSKPPPALPLHQPPAAFQPRAVLPMCLPVCTPSFTLSFLESFIPHLQGTCRRELLSPLSSPGWAHKGRGGIQGGTLLLTGREHSWLQLLGDYSSSSGWCQLPERRKRAKPPSFPSSLTWLLSFGAGAREGAQAKHLPNPSISLCLSSLQVPYSLMPFFFFLSFIASPSSWAFCQSLPPRGQLCHFSRTCRFILTPLFYPCLPQFLHSVLCRGVLLSLIITVSTVHQNNQAPKHSSKVLNWINVPFAIDLLWC